MHDRALGTRLAAQRELETQYSRQNVIVTDLKKNGSALKSHLAAKQKEANALNSRIAALIAEEQRKAEADRRAREGGTPARGAASGAACTRRGSEEQAAEKEEMREKESVTADNSTKKKAEPARKRKEKAPQG